MYKRKISKKHGSSRRGFDTAFHFAWRLFFFSQFLSPPLSTLSNFLPFTLFLPCNFSFSFRLTSRSDGGILPLKLARWRFGDEPSRKGSFDAHQKGTRWAWEKTRSIRWTHSLCRQPLIVLQHVDFFFLHSCVVPGLRVHYRDGCMDATTRPFPLVIFFLLIIYGMGCE